MLKSSLAKADGRPPGVVSHHNRRKVRALSEECPLTAGRGDPTESATEIYRCMSVRVKWWGKSPPQGWRHRWSR